MEVGWAAKTASLANERSAKERSGYQTSFHMAHLINFGKKCRTNAVTRNVTMATNNEKTTLQASHIQRPIFQRNREKVRLASHLG